MDLIVWGASQSQIRIYYLLVLIAFIYILYKYRKNYLSVFIILLFFSGLFAFWGKNFLNFYRIGLTISIVYWLFRTNSISQPAKGSTSVIVSFLGFSLIFFITSIMNRDYPLIMLSQYSRYLILFSLFLIMNRYKNVPGFKDYLSQTVFDIIVIQVVLSFGKYFIMGATESIVGSISAQGGAMATTLPLLGFIFVWLRKKGVLQLKDWLLIGGLLFIGFVSLKRAVWFVMPVIVALIMFFIPKGKLPNKVIVFAVIAVPLVLYLGIRFNPSLNKEGRIGGSYDLGYALEFAADYTFGEDQELEFGSGRGGTTLNLFYKFFTGDYPDQNWRGYGLRIMYAADFREFQKAGFEVIHRGSATGVFQTMITNGYLGMFTLLWFVFSMLRQTPNKRFRLFLLGVFCWEYFFYTGMIIREPGLSFLLVYFTLLSGKFITSPTERTVPSGAYLLK